MTWLGFVMACAVAGGAFGTLLCYWLFAPVAPRFVASEELYRMPLVVAFAVGLVTLYEGHRRSQLASVRLWVGVVLAASISAVAAWALAIAWRKADSPTYALQAMNLALVLMAATLAMATAELVRRPRMVFAQAGCSILLGIGIYGGLGVGFGFDHLVRNDYVYALLGPCVGLSLALSYVVVPMIFDNVYVYVESAKNAKSLQKYRHNSTGFWSMSGDAAKLTFVDVTKGGAAAVNPSMVWVPETLVPEAATLRRTNSSLTLEFHPNNKDRYGNGKVLLDGEPLTLRDGSRVYDGARIQVGTVVFRVVAPHLRRAHSKRRTTVAATAMLVAALGAPSLASGAPERELVEGKIVWRRCPAQSAAPNEPVALIRFPDSPVGSTGRRTVLRVGWPADGQSMVSEAVDERRVYCEGPQAGEVRQLISVDVSNSMDRDVERGHPLKRWTVVVDALSHAFRESDGDAAVLPFACTYPSAETLGQLKFEPVSRAVTAIDTDTAGDLRRRVNNGQELFGVPARVGGYFTAAHAAVVDSLGYLETRARSNPSETLVYTLFTDGEENVSQCESGRQEPCGDVVEAVRSACRMDIDVRLFLAGEQTDKTLDTCLLNHADRLERLGEPGNRCRPDSCPAICRKEKLPELTTRRVGEVSMNAKADTRCFAMLGGSVLGDEGYRIKDAVGYVTERIARPPDAPMTASITALREVDVEVAQRLCAREVDGAKRFPDAYYWTFLVSAIPGVLLFGFFARGSGQ